MCEIVNHNAKPSEPSKELDELAHAVIGAALEVHRIVGPGLLESAYQCALAIELSARGILFAQQLPVTISYRDIAIGEARLDFLVADGIVVEVKACAALLPIHYAQVISYLKASNRRLGLLINFNVPLLRQGIKRVIRSR